MAKVKFDPKDFLLRKGEVLVMGVSGFFLLLMLIWGASTWSTAKDPEKESKQLSDKAKGVSQKINNGTADPADSDKIQLPPWVVKPYVFNTASATAFKQSGPLFDPTAQPSTKRENPGVLTIGEYQVDMTRAAMLGYDIIFDPTSGDALIAVLTTKSENKLDDEKIKKATDDLRAGVDRNFRARQKLRDQLKQQNQNNGPGPGGVGPMGPGPGGVGPGPGGFGSMPPMGMMPPGMSPGGTLGGTYEQNNRRTEQAIKYIPLKEIDTAIKAGNLPAFTVLPLRLVTVHAVVPYKKQLEEIKRSLRLPIPPMNAKKEDIERSDAEAKQWGPWYDGFEVQRRVTRIMPNGQEVVIEDWPDTKDPKDTSGNYKVEELYIDRIDTKKIADHFDEGYIPYFLKQDMALSMPMPQLAKDLNVKYPEIKLKDILDNIEKLKKANQKEIPQSELAMQLSKRPGRSIYGSRTADNVAGLGYDPKKYGPTLGGMGMSGMPPTPPMQPLPGIGPGGRPQFPEGYGPNGVAAVANEVDNFLLRFVDCDVMPGRTYEYRIRLRMFNPNFGQDKLVAVPEYAKENYKILYSKWTQTTKISVPPESFLYADDVKAYRDHINDTYPTEGKEATAETRALYKLLQVKENQAVVQVATWMEQVRAGDAGKREPVGAWVVAEMPVGRGEFVGRKQYIKLPLWSSESQQYILREVTDKVVKGKFQPKGWLVDFSTPSVLVDFEGGRVKTKVNIRFDTDGNVSSSTRNIEEDAATELLIVGQDGKLVVRSSTIDDADPTRRGITTEWNRWVKEVESRKAAGGTGMGEPNPFDPKK